MPAYIDEGLDHPNEEIVRAKYGYVEIGGFSYQKRAELAKRIKAILDDWDTRWDTETAQ